MKGRVYIMGLKTEGGRRNVVWVDWGVFVCFKSFEF